MARMIPDLDPEQIDNPGERDVYRVLQKCPSSWVARYHYPFVWRDGNRMRDGEADFIVLIPLLGMLVLEVKSSHGYDSVDGVWHRVDEDGVKTETKDPFDQAMTNKHQIVAQLCKKVYHVDKSQFPGLYGFAVIYPRAKVEGSLPSSVDPLLITANKHMPQLESRLTSVLRTAGSKAAASQFDGKEFTRAVSFFRDTSKLVPVLAPSVSDDERKINALTQNQFDALRGLFAHQRLHIRGNAGSGKTLLACWSAASLSSQGHRVLLTCFNRNLARWIIPMVGSESNLSVRPFFSMARKVIQKAGLPFEPARTGHDVDKFWKERVPILLDEALESLPPETCPQYDAIVVDEAQDFAPSWWLPLMLMLKDPDKGLLQIFSDDEQAGVYGESDGYPSGLLEMPLADNCRNTKLIARFAGKLINQRARSFALSPEGRSPTIHPAVGQASERAAQVKAVFNDLCDQGFGVDQIAILSPYSNASSRSCLGHIRKIRNMGLYGDDTSLGRWRAGECIWGSTVKSFKGMEADCIILSDIAQEHLRGDSLADTYVGATRAKHLLHVIPSDGEAVGELLRLASHS